jgi:hypothetical protein
MVEGVLVDAEVPHPCEVSRHGSESAHQWGEVLVFTHIKVPPDRNVTCLRRSWCPYIRRA